MADEADKKFDNNYLKPKFAYLKLVCQGRSQPKNDFIANLRDFIQTYPNDDVTKNAQNILSILTPEQNQDKKDTSATSKSKKDFSKYMNNTGGKYYYVMVYPVNAGNVNTVKDKFSTYDSKYYSLLNLNISAFLFTPAQQLIMVREFPDQANAKKYFNGIKNDAAFLKSLNLHSYKHFIISTKNFTILMNDKDLDTYLSYFNSEYHVN